MKNKILFICKKRIDSYGISYGLINSARFIANKLNQSGRFEAKVVSVLDANAIDKEVFLYKPTHVIIHALWVTPQKIKELTKKWKLINWAVIIHSKIPFLANEGIAFDWLCKYKQIAVDNFSVAANSISVAKDLRETMGIKAIYLPNIYCPGKESKTPIKKDKKALDIGCFGALRPMKNHMNQAIAAVEFANNINRKLRFHINSERTEQNGEQALKNLRAYFACIKEHQLVEHKWLDHKSFVDLVKTMHLGMQVSFSETFNIVAADFVDNNIPIIMGEDICWAPRMFCAEPNSTNNMLGKLKFAWCTRWICLQKISKLCLWIWNRRAFRIWKRYILKKSL